MSAVLGFLSDTGDKSFAIVYPFIMILMCWISGGMTMNHIKNRCRNEGSPNATKEIIDEDGNVKTVVKISKKGARVFSGLTIGLGFLIFFSPFLNTMGNAGENVNMYMVFLLIALIWLLVQYIIMSVLVFASDDCKVTEFEDQTEMGSVIFVTSMGYIFVFGMLAYLIYKMDKEGKILQQIKKTRRRQINPSLHRGLNRTTKQQDLLSSMRNQFR